VSQCYISLSLSLFPLPLFSIRLANRLFRPWIDARTIYIPSHIPSRPGYSDERFSPRDAENLRLQSSSCRSRVVGKKKNSRVILLVCLYSSEASFLSNENYRLPVPVGQIKKRLSIINDFPTSISSNFNSGFACCFSVGKERDWESNFESALYYYISDMIK